MSMDIGNDVGNELFAGFYADILLRLFDDFLDFELMPVLQTCKAWREALRDLILTRKARRFPQRCLAVGCESKWNCAEHDNRSMSHFRTCRIKGCSQICATAQTSAYFGSMRFEVQGYNHQVVPCLGFCHAHLVEGAIHHYAQGRGHTLICSNYQPGKPQPKVLRVSLDGSIPMSELPAITKNVLIHLSGSQPPK